MASHFIGQLAFQIWKLSSLDLLKFVPEFYMESQTKENAVFEKKDVVEVISITLGRMWGYLRIRRGQDFVLGANLTKINISVVETYQMGFEFSNVAMAG